MGIGGHKLGLKFYGRVTELRNRLSRARFFRGHGVHSPFVYDVVRNVFMRDTLLPGDRMKGYVRKITEDNRIDVSLQQEGYAQVKDSAEVLLQLVIGNGGHLPLNDDSSPEEVNRLTEMSKKVFKRSLGVLMKRGAVEVGEDGIKVKRQ